MVPHKSGCFIVHLDRRFLIASPVGATAEMMWPFEYRYSFSTLTMVDFPVPGNPQMIWDLFTTH